MKRHALALTSAQSAVIAAHASRLPAQWRERFLSSVGECFVGRDSVSTDDVIIACINTAHHMGLVA